MLRRARRFWWGLKERLGEEDGEGEGDFGRVKCVEEGMHGLGRRLGELRDELRGMDKLARKGLEFWVEMGGC